MAKDGMVAGEREGKRGRRSVREGEKEESTLLQFVL